MHDKPHKPALTWMVIVLATMVTASLTGCARFYHFIHYNRLSERAHEHHRSYFHSDDTGRIIPKDDCQCVVEPPCYGYEPTCWRRWPPECTSCPVDSEFISGGVIYQGAATPCAESPIEVREESASETATSGTDVETQETSAQPHGFRERPEDADSARPMFDPTDPQALNDEIDASQGKKTYGQAPPYPVQIDDVPGTELVDELSLGVDKQKNSIDSTGVLNLGNPSPLALATGNWESKVPRRKIAHRLEFIGFDEAPKRSDFDHFPDVDKTSEMQSLELALPSTISETDSTAEVIENNQSKTATESVEQVPINGEPLTAVGDSSEPNQTDDQPLSVAELARRTDAMVTSRATARQTSKLIPTFRIAATFPPATAEMASETPTVRLRTAARATIRFVGERDASGQSEFDGTDNSLKFRR